MSRQFVTETRWPICWRQHCVHPIHKRKSTVHANNYRGVHLTVQLSKVVERVAGRIFLGTLQREGAFGERQFAYSVGRGHHDVSALPCFPNCQTWKMDLWLAFTVPRYRALSTGSANKIVFDAGKESFPCIHRTQCFVFEF